MSAKSPWIWIVLSVAILTLTLLVLIPGFMFRGQEDINIKTGQAHRALYVFFWKISETTQDTPLSAALAGQVIDVAPIQAWHRVNTWSLVARYSPHYDFHSALYQAHQLTWLSDLYGLTPAQQADIAREILTRWQTAGSDSAAAVYLVELYKGFEATQKAGAPSRTIRNAESTEQLKLFDS